MTARIAVAFAAALALAPAVAAQDAPNPAKRENKVTDAAKAAFEKMEKALYSPVAAGLKDISGTLELKVDGEATGQSMSAMGDMNLAFQVAWKAGEDVKVEPKGEAQVAMRFMSGSMMNSAGSMLRLGLGLMKPVAGEEYDADAVVEGGKTVLTVVHRRDGVEWSRTVITLDDLGRIESIAAPKKALQGGSGGPPGAPAGSGTRVGPPGGEEPAMRYSWKKEGDRWLLEKVTQTVGPKSVEMTPVYTDAGGFKILTSWKMSGGLGGMNFGFRFTDLVVNGKPVALASGDAGKAPGAEGGMGGTGGEAK